MLKEACRQLEIVGGQGVLHGLADEALLFIPLAGSPMQQGNQSRFLVPQTVTHHLCEEVVIAVPLPPIVQWREKELSCFDALEHRLSCGLARDGFTERAAQA